MNFIDHLVSAVDQAEQAVNHITYPAYPNLNKDIIEKINNAINLLEDCIDADIFKP